MRKNYKDANKDTKNLNSEIYDYLNKIGAHLDRGYTKWNYLRENPTVSGWPNPRKLASVYHNGVVQIKWADISPKETKEYYNNLFLQNIRHKEGPITKDESEIKNFLSWRQRRILGREDEYSQKGAFLLKDPIERLKFLLQ